MIKFELYDNLNIRINTDNREYLRAVKEHFSYYKEGYRFSPLYKTGQWDGKISLFSSMRCTIPYGLFLELVKFNKKNFSDKEFYISPEVKELFKGLEPSYDRNLNLTPYDYQDDCIKSCLKTKKCIIRLATGGGKSLVISYVLMALKDKGELNRDKRAILIVPSIGLVTQFYSDMEEYGIDMSMIGRVGDTWKEWDKNIIISTWQSLSNIEENIELFNTVIVDETHCVTGEVLRDLLSKAKNAEWRFGFTGTMPDDILNYNQVMSYIGPVTREYGSAELAKLGFIAKCNINLVHMDYNTKFKGEYNDIKKAVFENEFRLSVIEQIVEQTDGSILILVGKVKDEGQFLEEVIKTSPNLGDREVVFLSGKDNAKEREFWRQYTDKSDKVVLIATYAIFQAGVNIKSLAHLIMASPFKSKIRILQSIGRTLRLHGDKINGATIWDICDNVKHLREHSNVRIKHYAKEKFDMTDIFLKEGYEVEIKRES